MDELYVFLPFIILLFIAISLQVYSKSCYVLYEYIEQINIHGEIKNRVEYPIFSFFSMFYLFISIPSQIKYPHYYEFSLLKEEVDVIIKFRKFFLVVFIVFIAIIAYFLYWINFVP